MVKFKKIVLFYVCLSLSLSMFNLQYFKHNFIVKANEVLEENSNDAIEEVVDKKILSEVEELRDESSKTFFMSDRSFQKIIYANAVVDGATSFGLGKIPGIKGATAGRNSWSAVYKSGLTKLRNGTAARMSVKVVAKGLGSSIVGGFALDGYYGVKQHAYDRVKYLLN